METLYNGDCLKELKNVKDESVDMILTDPPYGMEFVSSHRKEKHKAIANDDNLDWIDSLVDECFRVAKDDTAHYIFCSFHKIDIFKQAFEKKFTVKNILVWEKNNTSMGDLEGDFAPKVEFILFLHKGRAKIIGKREPNIFTFKRTNNALHPTQKPVSICKFLISKFSKKGDVVLDMYMGSGTTGVACKEMDRDFIGIELDVDYFKIASDRITEIDNTKIKKFFK